MEVEKVEEEKKKKTHEFETPCSFRSIADQS
jgi:hypothetical protein